LTELSCAVLCASLFETETDCSLTLIRLSSTNVSTTAVCDLALSFGEGADGDSAKRMSRPFGVALLLAGWDDVNGCQLYFSDPSGTFTRYKAKAIGAGSEGAQSNLEESYAETMSLAEAEELALSTLKQVMEEKISTDNVELARVTPERGFHIATPEEVGAVLERLAA
jgi:20S proteasome subunit alpha 5